MIITKEYGLIKGMFPDYLEETNIDITEDRITINFKSKRKFCICPTCNTDSSTVSTYFTRKIAGKIVFKSILP